jgi:hypothetical protein
MKLRKRKCPCCGQWFTPKPQTAYHQRFCSSASCQRIRRRVTQARWRRRNRDYFRGKENVDRVRLWRSLHRGTLRPRYLRLIRIRLHLNRSISLPFALRKAGALQDLWLPQVSQSQRIAEQINTLLQDLCVFSCLSVFFCLRCR